MFAITIALLAGAAILPAKDLLATKDLSNWEVRGDGLWTLRKDKVLVGQRKLVENAPKPGAADYNAWFYTQAWIYTKQEFEEFDLTLEYWLPMGGNSGVSLRDTSRAEFAIAGPQRNATKTPSRLAYEIQLNNHYPDKYPSASIYNFVAGKTGLQQDFEWNQLRVESRATGIRVFLNGVLAAEHPGDPNRPKRGPIGLQLHDQRSVVMFRNIQIKER